MTDLNPVYYNGSVWQHDLHYHSKDTCFACRLDALATEIRATGPMARLTLLTHATEAEDDLFREQLEQVIGIEYGELRRPNRCRDDWDVWFPYWYDGLPEYASHEFDEDRRFLGLYRTVVMDLLFRESEVAAPPGWRVVREFHNSGERECYACGPDSHLAEDGVEVGPDWRCPYCENDNPKEQGHVYIGDGWAEVVFEQIKDWLDEDERDELVEHIVRELIDDVARVVYSRGVSSTMLYDTLAQGFTNGPLREQSDKDLWLLACQEFNYSGCIVFDVVKEK